MIEDIINKFNKKIFPPITMFENKINESLLKYENEFTKEGKEAYNKAYCNLTRKTTI